MYSILIRTKGADWHYHLDDDEAVWEGTKTEAQAEVVSLLATLTTTDVKVVHNCKIDFSGVTVSDITE